MRRTSPPQSRVGGGPRPVRRPSDRRERNRGAPMRRQLLAVGAGEVAPAVLGVAAFACAVLADLGVLALALTCVALALVWLSHRPLRPATAVPVRVLLAAA